MYRYLVKNLLYYPSNNKLPIYIETKRIFKANKHLTDENEIEKELRKARLGVAHIQMFIEQNSELRENYFNSGAAVDNSINLKDKNFVYF